MNVPQTKAMAEIAATGFASVMNTHVHMRLYKSTFTPGVNNVLADFLANEVAFTGYTPADLSSTAFVVGIDADDNVELVSGLTATFTQTGVGATDSAGGWFLVNDAGPPPTALWGHGTLDAPFPFTKTGNRLSIIPQLPFPLLGDQVAKTMVGP